MASRRVPRPRPGKDYRGYRRLGPWLTDADEPDWTRLRTRPRPWDAPQGPPRDEGPANPPQASGSGTRHGGRVEPWRTGMQRRRALRSAYTRGDEPFGDELTEFDPGLGQRPRLAEVQGVPGAPRGAGGALGHGSYVSGFGGYAGRRYPPDAPRGAARPRFAGRGPGNWQRSDERLYEEVCERLMDDPRLDASDIEVAVEEAEVTLRGSVTSRRDKRRAEDLAAGILGVRDVHNRLRLASAGGRGVP